MVLIKKSLSAKELAHAVLFLGHINSALVERLISESEIFSSEDFLSLLGKIDSDSKLLKKFGHVSPDIISSFIKGNISRGDLIDGLGPLINTIRKAKIKRRY